MVQFVPPPDSRALLQPLLACLPTAFASSRPPPALSTLLSPILRQRVQILSASSSSSDSWLTLLCWDPQRAAKLPEIVKKMDLEPHPVSGEVEIDDIQDIRYRRLDEETLQARLDLEQFGLLSVYLWSEPDEANPKRSWRLTELRALEDSDDGTQWFTTMSEADENSGVRARGPATANGNGVGYGSGANSHSFQDSGLGDDDDDDDYWAAYDKTPGRTPAQKRSPAPPANSNVQIGPTASEMEYFARYLSEVQPAADPHDPSEAGVGPGESTLHGEELTHGQGSRQGANLPSLGPNGHGSALPTHRVDENSNIEHPRPSSASSMEGSIERLEESANHFTQAEVAIKQHISTDIKSLFRLSKAAGISRAEFTRLVETELSVLQVLEADEYP